MGSPEQRPKTGAGVGGIDVYAVPDSAYVDEELLHESIFDAVKNGEISFEDFQAENEFLDLASDAAANRYSSNQNSDLGAVLYSEKLPQGGRLVYLVGKNRRDKPTIQNFEQEIKLDRRSSEIRKAARFDAKLPENAQPVAIEIDPDDLSDEMLMTYAIDANLAKQITDKQLALIAEYLTLAGDRNINLRDKIRYGEDGKCYLMFIFSKD